ncbi:MAG: Rap1a/Tai family immunity protein [Desulfobacterales bacterium]
MKYRLLLVILIFGFISPVSVGADAVRGEQLLYWLTGKADNEIEATMDRAKSMAYLSGMLDSYVVLSAIDPGLKIYCVPEKGISIVQAKDIVVQWLNRHPDRLKEEARILVLYALKDAFPCK